MHSQRRRVGTLHGQSQTMSLSGIDYISTNQLYVGGLPVTGGTGGGMTPEQTAKLAGIEEKADVTDIKNVESAGALMRSGGTMDAGAEILGLDQIRSIVAIIEGLISCSVINEYTSGSGVTVDGVLIKDGLVDGKDVSTLSPVDSTTVAAAGALMKSGGTMDTGADILGLDTLECGTVTASSVLRSDIIIETKTGAGVTVEGVLIKNGLVDGVDVSTITPVNATTVADAGALMRTGGLMLPGSSIQGIALLHSDIINETTSNAGVTVEGVLIKDGLVDGVDVKTIVTVDSASVSAAGALMKSGGTMAAASTITLGGSGGRILAGGVAISSPNTGELSFTRNVQVEFQVYAPSSVANASVPYIYRCGVAKTNLNSLVSAWYNASAGSTANYHRTGIFGLNTDMFVFHGLGHNKSCSIYPATDDFYNLGSTTSRWDDIYATNATIQTSDETDKSEIKETSLGLSFINKLKPRQWKWKRNTQDVSIGIGDGKKNISKRKLPKRFHHGLVAQEVESVLTELKVTTNDFAGFIKDAETGQMGLRYTEFIAPVIKSIQELTQRVERLELRLLRL